MRKRFRFAATALAVLAGTALVVSQYSPATATSDPASQLDAANLQQVGQVEAAARTFLIHHWQNGQPERALGGAPGELTQMPTRPGTGVLVAHPDAPASKEEALAANKRAEANMATDLAHASPALLAREQRTLENLQAALADPKQRIQGAGVSEISVGRATSSGSQATVEGTMISWTRFQVQQSDGRWIESSLSGPDAFSVELESVGGKWFVVNAVVRPLEGSKP